MELTSFRQLVPTDEERQDEPGRVEPMLANQGTNAG
jgi:hypothetical protein